MQATGYGRRAVKTPTGSTGGQRQPRVPPKIPRTQVLEHVRRRMTPTGDTWHRSREGKGNKVSLGACDRRRRRRPAAALLASTRQLVEKIDGSARLLAEARSCRWPALDRRSPRDRRLVGRRPGLASLACFGDHTPTLGICLGFPPPPWPMGDRLRVRSSRPSPPRPVLSSLRARRAAAGTERADLALTDPEGRQTSIPSLTSSSPLSLDLLSPQ